MSVLHQIGNDHERHAVGADPAYTNPESRQTKRNTLVAFVVLLLVEEVLEYDDEFVEAGVDVEVMVDEVGGEGSDVFAEEEAGEVGAGVLKGDVDLDDHGFVGLAFDVQVGVALGGVDVVDGRVGVGELGEGGRGVQFLGV